MDRCTHQSLEYRFGRIILGRLRTKRVPDARALADDLAQRLMEEVPTGAFDAADPFDAGLITFGSDVTENAVLELNHQLRSAHLTLKKGVPIRVLLNSFGGNVFDGLTVVSTMQEIQREGRDVDVHVAGCAMSMGSVILQAGTKRTIDAHGFLMLHEIGYGVEHTKTSLHADMLEEVRALQRATFALYSARTGKPVEYYLKKFDRRDWTMTAAEALEERLVDEIIAAPAYRAHRRKSA